MVVRQLSDIAHTLDGTYYKYGFVGSGAQFRVYAVFTNSGKSTGRVIKVPLDYDETQRAILEPLRLLNPTVHGEAFEDLAERRTREVMGFTHETPRLTQGIMGTNKTIREALGNLRILQTPVASPTSERLYQLPTLFTQDYVLTLDEYLQKFRLADNPYARTLDMPTIRQLKRVIDQVVQLNIAIWEFGIFEFVFKPENFGIRTTSRGDIELLWIDLAEHITELKEAESILAERRWRHATMPHKIDYQFMPTILHEEYIAACDKAFTVETLRKHWLLKYNRTQRLQSTVLQVKEFMTRNDKAAVKYWINRHTLPNTLRSGFSEMVIDDMQIPAEDIELLMNDRQYTLSDAQPSPEEKLERSRFTTTGSSTPSVATVIKGKF
ncbi:MAG TPA: hypothetical protein VJ841_00450 [Candidatus Saccharimonadales bacterium]|nr:hypothetical protein [Candidatus Saccharimonadales bacterium]